MTFVAKMVRILNNSQWLTLVLASVMLVLTCVGTIPLMPKAEATTSAGNYTFLNDTLGNNLSGWQYYGASGYQLALDSTTGVPSPSAHISGDAWFGNCSKHGMYKVVDISSYAGGSLTLAFNWRASSSSTYGTTEAEVRVDNADTGAPLFVYTLANSGVSDTGWQYYSNKISNYISTEKRVQIDLYLLDCWQANYNENNWYDNISLVWNTAPTSPNAPTGLNATAVSSSQINLAWNAPQNNGGSPVTGYKIERSTDFGSTWSTLVTNTGSIATTYSDTGLQSKYYTYRVSAIDAIGTGQSSNPATANTSGGKTTEFSSNTSFSGTLNHGDTLIIDKGVTVSSDGITNNGNIINAGAIQMNSSKTLENYGTILNNGSGQISSSINNYHSGVLVNQNGNFYFFQHSLNNYGNFTTYGGISSAYGYITNYATGVIESHGSGKLYNAQLTNYGLVNSYGYLELDWGGIYTNGTFNNHASISLFPVQGGDGITNDVGGTFNNFAGSQVSIPGRTGGYQFGFFNYGTVNNAGSFLNNDLIKNWGAFNNDGTVYNVGQGGYAFPIPTISNYGTFNNNPD